MKEQEQEAVLNPATGLALLEEEELLLWLAAMCGAASRAWTVSGQWSLPHVQLLFQ